MDIRLDELVDYIDWMPFFNAWEFHGKYPQILSDPVVGEEATKLMADANRLLEAVIADRWLHANAVSSVCSRRTATVTILFCTATNSGRESARDCIFCVSSAASPTASRICAWRTTSRRLTAAIPTTSAVSSSALGTASMSTSPASSRDHDDYNSIMLKALADRLAEAAAELPACAGAAGAVGLRRLMSQLEQRGADR